MVGDIRDSPNFAPRLVTPPAWAGALVFLVVGSTLFWTAER